MASAVDQVEAAHTPGPWEWNEANTRLSRSYPESFASVNVLVVHDARFKPSDADARLICAAPDLLEEAQQALDLITSFQGSFDDGGSEGAFTERLLAERVVKLRAAIAKATGASS